MLPLAIALGAGGAVSGYMKGKKNERVQEENDRYRKAVLQYSPWTKMQDPGAYVAGPGALESAFNSGAKGAVMGSMFGGAGGGTSALSTGMGGGAGAADGLSMAGGAGGMTNSMEGLGMTPGGGQMGKWQLLQQQLMGQDPSQMTT